LLESQGKSAEAEPLYHRSLAICEKTLGPEHPTTQTVRKNLKLFGGDAGQVKSGLGTTSFQILQNPAAQAGLRSISHLKWFCLLIWAIPLHHTSFFVKLL
jgi:hypothetical protein